MNVCSKQLMIEDEPQSYQQAIRLLILLEWLTAMKDEMNSLRKLGVYKLVKRPEECEDTRGKMGIQE